MLWKMLYYWVLIMLSTVWMLVDIPTGLSSIKFEDNLYGLFFIPISLGMFVNGVYKLSKIIYTLGKDFTLED